MGKERYTIRDIATMANVSRGTVDRVIHNRGTVSEEAEKKVKEVLEKINYEPNLIARSLKANKDHVIAVVIPDYSDDYYWRQCAYGIRRSEKEFRQFGVSLQYFQYSRTQEDYNLAFSKAIDLDPDAVLIAPVYYQDSLALFQQLEAKHIPYNLINTPIEEVNYHSFIGQDYRKSGRVAGQLMSAFAQGEKKILVIHVEQHLENSTHLHEKEQGFKDYFNDRGITQEIEVLTFKDARELNGLKPILPGTAGIFMTTSKTYLVADHIGENKDIKVIGYDLIPENVKYLREGKIDILIHQNPIFQGYDGISLLTDFLIYKKDVPKVKLLPLDIVIAENVDCYL